jgi:transcriptional regulator with XRE-family HTH domain
LRASFAATFSAWRKSSKVPLKKIAKDLGVSIATVNFWECGQRFPSADNLIMIVSYTGLPPCRLVCLAADGCVQSECLPIGLHRKRSRLPQ